MSDSKLLIEDSKNISAEKIIGRMFGSAINSHPVEIIKDEKAETITNRLFRNAVNSIYSISVTGHYLLSMEKEILFDESIEKKFLFFDCDSKTSSDTFESRPNFGIQKSLIQYDKWYKILKNSKNIKIRIYNTFPWLRGTFVDNKMSVFLMPLHFSSGRETVSFYTSDNFTIKNMLGIFKNIWEDPRTVDFEQFYKEYKQN